MSQPNLSKTFLNKNYLALKLAIMKQAPKFLLLASVFVTLAGCAGSIPSNNSQNNNQTVNAQTQSAASFNYDDYGAALAKYVDDQGLVNYQGLQDNPQQLEAFNAALAQVDSSTYESWTDEEKIAFWSNAYNSFTLQAIINEKPLKKSIKNIFGVWKIKQWDILNQSKTLDGIEHGTIRANFDEPRIHVALVCAAVSCPPLRNEPYTGARLDEQFDDQTRRFIASPQGFRIDRDSNVVYLSKIFDWYGDDWIKSYGVEDGFTGDAGEKAVLNFISGYLPEEDREYLAQGNYNIKYLKYDWSLNKQ